MIKTIDIISRELWSGDWFGNQKFFDIDYLENPKINMINSNFKLPFNVDTNKLYKLALNNNLQYICDEIINYSCIKIKYSHGEKTVSIFIFEKGSAVLSGCQNYEQIKKEYEFINNFLNSNFKQIVKNTI